MKTIITSIFLLLLVQLHAELDLKSGLNYEVVSDKADPTVAPGLCLVTGIVYYQGLPIGGATISSSQNLGWNTATDGKFSFLVDTSEHHLVFNHPNHDKIELDYDFKSGHRLELEIIYPSEYEMVLKPVIYAYAPQETEVEFKLKSKAALTFTYPLIQNNSWKVKTQADGMLQDQNGKQFPYLFWEAQVPKGFQFINWYGVYPGALLKRDSVLSYLETSLAALGLNEREATDFITFWGPRMVQQDYAFVQFWIDADYNRVAELEVNPKPDNLRRIYMLYTNFASYPEKLHVRPQEFEAFKRDGLTVVEWGGSSVPANLMIH